MRKALDLGGVRVGYKLLNPFPREYHRERIQFAVTEQLQLTGQVHFLIAHHAQGPYLRALLFAECGTRY